MTEDDKLQLKARNHRDSNPRSSMRGEPAPLQPIFSARVEEPVKSAAEAWIKASGWTKRQFVEYAIEQLIGSMSPEEAREMNQKLRKHKL